jgi:hypothetical protein
MIRLNSHPLAHRRPCRQALFISVWVAITCFSSSLFAFTVHTWLDAEGIRHYADAPPAESVAQSERIEFADTPPGDDDTAADYYSISNQWARLRDERDASDARALERKKLLVEQRKLQSESAPRREDDAYRNGGYRGYAPYYRGQYGSYGQGFGARSGGGGHADRARHISERRHHGFSPTPVPVWPRQR